MARYASYDGTQIPGILYRPRGASASAKVPAMVIVHGGPGGPEPARLFGDDPAPRQQRLCGLAINNRGSSGYGKTFYHMDDRRHGDVDLRDVVASRDWLAGQDWISATASAIIGGSYGGYMTAAALAFHPTPSTSASTSSG